MFITYTENVQKMYTKNNVYEKIDHVKNDNRPFEKMLNMYLNFFNQAFEKC